MKNTHMPKMTVKSRQIGAYEYICSPACELSYLACTLVDQDFLTSKQIKTLELMGFDVFVEEEYENNTYQED